MSPPPPPPIIQFFARLFGQHHDDDEDVTKDGRPSNQGHRRPIPKHSSSSTASSANNSSNSSSNTTDEVQGIPVNEPKDGPEPIVPIWPNDDTCIVQVVSPSDINDPSSSSSSSSNVLATLQALQDPSEQVTTQKVTYKNQETGQVIPPGTVTNPIDDPPMQVFRPQETHFSERRAAILFQKGVYQKLDLQIGYYVQALGLGHSASDVVFQDADYGIYCPAYNTDQVTLLYKNGDTIEGKAPVGDSVGSSLDTFWRSAENFTNNTTNGMMWAVSQAAPLRRVHAQNSLALAQAGYSSGGHVANTRVEGRLDFVTQQQFCCRNVTLPANHTNHAQWNTVYVNCDPPPESEENIVVSHQASVTVEKPFLALTEDEQGSSSYVLHVPQPRSAGVGADLTGETDEIRSFANVYVARSKVADFGATDYDVARKINKALSQGKDVVLSPGIYTLSQTIIIPKNNQVLLGIGMATLVAPTDGTPCVQVAPNIQGVRVAGITMEASHLNEDRTTVASFLEWGQEGVVDPGMASNPGVMNDVFCRVGGSSLDRAISTDVMIRIHSGHVLGDNLWLWRADHMALRTGQPGVPDETPNVPGLDYHQTMLGEVPVKSGLQVFGDNVVMHGLAVEHTIEDQVQWFGNNGQVYFYQCELPYDVTQDFGTQGYLGFSVDSNVETMTLAGAGVYSNFRDYDVQVPTAMFHPHAQDAPSGNGKPQQVTNLFTTHLDNQGLIQTVVTDGTTKLGGAAVANGGQEYYNPGEQKESSS